jgi:hypothetical protein
MRCILSVVTVTILGAAGPDGCAPHSGVSGFRQPLGPCTRARLPKAARATHHQTGHRIVRFEYYRRRATVAFLRRKRASWAGNLAGIRRNGPATLRLATGMLGLGRSGKNSAYNNTAHYWDHTQAGYSCHAADRISSCHRSTRRLWVIAHPSGLGSGNSPGVDRLFQLHLSFRRVAGCRLLAVPRFPRSRFSNGTAHGQAAQHR